MFYFVFNFYLFTENLNVMKKMDEWFYHSRALQEYILICCQCSNGGLIDKPGK